MLNISQILPSYTTVGQRCPQEGHYARQATVQRGTSPSACGPFLIYKHMPESQLLPNENDLVRDILMKYSETEAITNINHVLVGFSSSDYFTQLSDNTKIDTIAFMTDLIAMIQHTDPSKFSIHIEVEVSGT
jgi:hypothetical protein